MEKHRSDWFLALIIVLYVILGALYALYTPKWQTPDEPAHWNYIEYVAQNGRFPVLQVGDYPAQYLEEIKAAHFPSNMSIAPIRYESHQPPLYYALAAVLCHLTTSLQFDLQFFALRLLSVVLGAALLAVAYRLVRDIFPNDDFLALATTAFIAVVPMHLAMSAAINNDTLAELLLLLILWQSILTIRDGLSTRRAIITGILLGLVLLTKTTIYLPAAGVIVLAALWNHTTQTVTTSAATRRTESVIYLLSVFMLALLLAAPWFMRNALVYGGLDILGWQRHELVVAGQLRTAELLAQIGLLALTRQFVLTTFHSFWAQFGWMGVLVDERIYLALMFLSAILVAGFIAFVLRLRQGKPRLNKAQRRALALLAASTLLSLLTYLGYNIGFVQHQGRYLFPALGPLALGVALSLHELLRPRTARWLALALLAVSSLLLAYGWLRGDIPKWSLALLIAGASFWACIGWLGPDERQPKEPPTRWQWMPPLLLYAAFLTLDLFCLFFYVIPYLS